MKKSRIQPKISRARFTLAIPVARWLLHYDVYQVALLPGGALLVVDRSGPPHSVAVYQHQDFTAMVAFESGFPHDFLRVLACVLDVRKTPGHPVDTYLGAEEYLAVEEG